MKRLFFKSGAWNAICDVCGFKFKSFELKTRWDGLKVCKKDWEPRHPLDLIRIRGERAFPQWVRPEAADTFINVPYICTPEGSTAVPGYAVVGCAIVGRAGASSPVLTNTAIVGKAIVGLAIVGKT